MVGIMMVGCHLPLLLADTRVDSNTREVALLEKAVEFRAPGRAPNKDDDLIEFKIVEEIIEFAVFLTFFKLDVVLLQSVKGQLLLVVNINFRGVPHESAADLTCLLRQGGTKHHDLLLGRGGPENLLHVPTHI